MELKGQRFGIEIEMTGITRQHAAEVAAEYFGTNSSYTGSFYSTYAVLDGQGRQWKFMRDSSIKPQRREGRRKVSAGSEYQTEMVSPICRYGDIVPIQELIRRLKAAGACVNPSCGIHVHIDALPFDARTLRNITNIMASKEDLIYKALQVDAGRELRYCRKVDNGFLEELNSRKPKTTESFKTIWYEQQRDDSNGISEHYHDSRYHCLNLHSVFQKGTVDYSLY